MTSDQHFQKNPFLQKETLYRSVLGQASNYFLRKFPNDCQNVDRLELTMGATTTYEELLFYLVVTEVLLSEYVAIDFCEQHAGE